METVTDFILGGSKITAGGDCSHEIKWCLLLGRKAMTNLDSILKHRDITLPTKFRIVKAIAVIMYGCESWTIKKAQHQRIDAFQLSCWKCCKTLENPLESKEIKLVNPKWNQSWIFIGMTDFDPEAPIFGYLIWRGDSLEKTLMLGKIVCRRRRGVRLWDGWMASLTQ